MVYKKVEKIAEEISAIGIGCWNMGGDWDSSEENTSIRIIHAAIDLGINFFDVAPVYGWGVSETILGKALKEGGRRDKVLIASKGGLLWNEKHQTRNNLSKDSLLKEIDDTLTRLQTDHVDIYQMHWPDPNVPLEETAEALNIMKKAGKIRYVGLSNFSQADVEKMMEYISVDCQQGLYNMLERNPGSYHGISLEYRTEKEVFPNVKKYGQAFLPYSPLFQGLLPYHLRKGYPQRESQAHRRGVQGVSGRRQEAEGVCGRDRKAHERDGAELAAPEGGGYLHHRRRVFHGTAGEKPPLHGMGSDDGRAGRDREDSCAF